jgi:hypothetical protein
MDKELRRILGESAGEISMCWSEIPKGVFDSTKALSIVDKIEKAFIEELGKARKEGYMQCYDDGMKGWAKIKVVTNEPRPME